MVSTRLLSRWMAAVLLLCAVFAPAAQAQVTRQTLDRVDVYNASSVLEMAFADAISRPADFFKTGISGAAISSCKLTPAQGLYCVDNNVLRRWADPHKPTESKDLLNCTDAKLGLGAGIPSSCIGMTVDLSGAIWIAGRKGATYSLIKVVAKDPAAACAVGWRDLTPLTGGNFCASDYYSGRQRITGLETVDGDAATSFKACPTCAPQSGVVGFELRYLKSDPDDDLGRIPVFFPDAPGALTADIGDRAAWGINVNERLQSLAVFQLANSGGSLDNFVLVTTNKGRILARNTATTGVAVQVFDIPAERPLAVSGINATQCAVLQAYGIRASSRTGFVYVSDRAFCEVLALLPQLPATPFNKLVNAIDAPLLDRTLRTVNAAGANPPNGLTIAPGVSIDLSKCAPSTDPNSKGCPLLKDSNGTVAAYLSNVKLVDTTKSGLTLFQVKGIPDCRYVEQPEFPTALKAVCKPNGVLNPALIEGPAGIAAAQRLNVTPLLPREITGQFDASGLPPKGLPRLLISPQYRGQKRNGYVFEALFAISQPGVQFLDTFGGEFDVGLLEGGKVPLGCVPALTGDGLSPQNSKFVNPTLGLAWDVVTRVSEIDVSVDGKYVDTLTNTGCGTTKTTGNRLSLLPYDLEIAPDTYGPLYGTAVPTEVPGNDAAFGRLLQSLHADLNQSLASNACPIYGTVGASCGVLQALADTSKAQLDLCVGAAFVSRSTALTPTTVRSSGDDGIWGDDDDYTLTTIDPPCPIFVQYLQALRSAVSVLPTATNDTANRRGELLVRADVIQHVYDTRFVPSIPDTGFCREKGVGTATQCAPPWTYPTQVP